MRKIKMNEIKDEIKRLMLNNNEEILYCISDGLYIFRGLDGAVKDKYLRGSHNIFELGQSGGTIVSSKGDIEMAFFKYDGWNQAQTWLNLIAEYLKSRGLNITVIGNDIIADDKYKVGAYGSLHLGNKKIFSTIQISINADADLINDICLKPMVKIPKGLSEYGITTEEMELAIININEVIDNAS